MASAVFAGCGGSGSSSSSGGFPAGSPDVKSFCRDYNKATDDFQTKSDRLAPLSKADYQKVVDQISNLIKEAPAEAKADLTVVMKGAEQAVKTGSGFSDSSAVRAADERLATYADDHCD